MGSFSLSVYDEREYRALAETYVKAYEFFETPSSRLFSADGVRITEMFCGFPFGRMDCVTAIAMCDAVYGVPNPDLYVAATAQPICGNLAAFLNLVTNRRLVDEKRLNTVLLRHMICLIESGKYDSVFLNRHVFDYVTAGQFAKNHNEYCGKGVVRRKRNELVWQKTCVHNNVLLSLLRDQAYRKNARRWGRFRAAGFAAELTEYPNWNYPVCDFVRAFCRLRSAMEACAAKYKRK